MRGLSSRNVRPSLAQTKLLHTCTPVRRTFLLPNRRRFNAADAFSILLAPVLTTAFLFDTTTKQDKSKEFDRRIAVVEEETERLRERQIQAWSRLQKRSISNGVWQQRRSFSTAAQATEPEDEMEDPMDHDVTGQDPANEGARTPDVEVSDKVIRDVQLFDRLIATRLALQLLLQLKSGSNTVYALPIEDAPHEAFAEKHHSLDFILTELGKVGRMLHALYIKRLPYGVVHPLEYVDRRTKLGQELTELTDQYRRSEIHLPHFIMSYMNMIAKHQMGPAVSNYVEIMRVFQKMGIMPMAVIAESAVWEAQQYLNNQAVSSILFCHGTEMDAYRLKDLLKRLVRNDLFPRPANLWYRKELDDLRLATPSSKNPWVMASLIRATLCCQQFNIAEAYAQEFLRRDEILQYQGRFKCWLTAAFLAAYSRVGSWRYGLKWINQGIVWMGDMLNDGIAFGLFYLSRCVLRMLEYCVVCDKRDVYEELLQAAIVHKIPLPPIDATKPYLLSQRIRQVRMDWQIQSRKYYDEHNISQDSVLQENISDENLKAFQRKLWYIFELPEGGAARVRRIANTKIFDESEASEAYRDQDLPQLGETRRLKSVHQTPSDRTTTIPFMPPVQRDADVLHPPQYIFTPMVSSEISTVKHEFSGIEAQNVLGEVKSSANLNPGTPYISATSDGISKPDLEQSTSSTLNNDIVSQSTPHSTPTVAPSFPEESTESSLSAYAEFWPHMTLTGTNEAGYGTAIIQSEISPIVSQGGWSSNENNDTGFEKVQSKQPKPETSTKSKTRKFKKQHSVNDNDIFLASKMISSTG